MSLSVAQSMAISAPLPEYPYKKRNAATSPETASAWSLLMRPGESPTQECPKAPAARCSTNSLSKPSKAGDSNPERCPKSAYRSATNKGSFTTTRNWPNETQDKPRPGVVAKRNAADNGCHDERRSRKRRPGVGQPSRAREGDGDDDKQENPGHSSCRWFFGLREASGEPSSATTLPQNQKWDYAGEH